MSLITVRRSELETFRQCPLKHKIIWLERWQPAVDSEASDRGTDWHLVMFWHYGSIQAAQRQGLKSSVEGLGARVRERIDQRWAEHDPECWEKLRWMYDGYLDYWGVDPDWEILAVEETQVVPILDENEEPTPFQLEWTTDLRVRDRTNNTQLIVDHKSTEHPLGKLDVDLADQFGTYTFAERRAGNPILMQVLNQVKTKKLKRPMTLAERNSRTPGYRTDRELKAIELDLLGVAEAAYPTTPRRLYSSPDPRTCGWKCDVKDAHLALRKGAIGMDRLPTLMRSHGFVQKTPPSGIEET